MGLVDLLRGIGKKKEEPKEQEEKGTPLYRWEKKRYIDGRIEINEWKDMPFFEEVARLKKRYAPMYAVGKEWYDRKYNKIPDEFLDYDAIDGFVNKLIGKDVVIRKKNGFHYGKLEDFDGKYIYLDRYLHSKKLMDGFDYRFESPSGSRDYTRVQIGNILKMQKIPSDVEDPNELMDSVIESMAAEKLYGDFKGRKDLSMKDYFKGSVPLILAYYGMPHPQSCETGKPYSEKQYNDVMRDAYLADL
ncbi:hypothetical protein JXA85_00385 [Candidatus Woesearchaeota archaeon]|nr:hypothetical protein [Candidatus Woesearchaeota archaeon]